MLKNRRFFLKWLFSILLSDGSIKTAFLIIFTRWLTQGIVVSALDAILIAFPFFELSFFAFQLRIKEFINCELGLK